jgi:sigma-B regulation protein RsbU (phosphoserine phosphatase)
MNYEESGLMSFHWWRLAVIHAFHDWKRDMSPRARAILWVGILIQGFAIYAAITRSLVWPVIWPTNGFVLLAIVGILYGIGGIFYNGVLSSEFLRKTRMEADAIAARSIQRSLQPETLEAPDGYELDAVYEPFRTIGGDYFDIVRLSDTRTLIAIADVSGKGMAAALLSANVQALVRTLATIDDDLRQLASQMNRHLSRHTPGDRFATAVFIVLDHATGRLTAVNAGHNQPLLVSGGTMERLKATGIPLGMFEASSYDSQSATLAPGGVLLLFTDGLTDAIRADDPDEHLAAVMSRQPDISISRIRALCDPALIEDDVTIVRLARRLN